MRQKLLMSASLLTLMLVSGPGHAQNQSSAGMALCQTQQATITASATSAAIQFNCPAATTVALFNTGANAAYVKICTTSTCTATTANAQIPAGIGITINVPPSGYLATITASATTTLVAVQGIGSAALAGGSGGGGGGGGAVTIADGADVNSGATTDAAATAGSTGTLAAKLRLMTTQLDTINTSLNANGNVNLVQVNGNTALAGNGVTGTGSPRVTIASDNTPFPTKIDQTTDGTTNGVRQTTQYPSGAVGETASATGTTAATTATLATNTGQTTYICWFSIRANATAAATGNATVTGTITGTLNFTQWTAPNASGLGVTEMIFTPCIPASTTNTSIAVVSAAPGTGGVVSVSAGGYLK